MYRVTVPIMLSSFDPQTRSVYPDQMLRAGVDRVLLCLTRLPVSKEEEVSVERNLRETFPCLRSAGLEVGIWVGQTVGHGVVLNSDGDASRIKRFSPLIDVEGRTIAGTSCPLDPDFVSDLCEKLRRLADVAVPLGISLILLDDDFRMSIHGPSYCCACDRHMERIRTYAGKSLTREEVRDSVFRSPANGIREAWRRAQHESLVSLAERLRASVADYETLTLALCAAPCHLGPDGVSPVALTTVLAGKNPPILRSSGAPYWFYSNSFRFFPAVLEFARMNAALFSEGTAELWAEGDVYPRPRTIVPASALELFDAVMRADGTHTGILKYMFDYISSPTMETGYLEHHIADRPVLEEIGAEFSGKDPVGVRVFIDPAFFEVSDLSRTPLTRYSPVPTAGVMLAGNGIPTVYRGPGVCTAVFGEHAHRVDPAMLNKGAILDATAAEILCGRGIDVGLTFRDRIDTTARRLAGSGEIVATYQTSGSFALCDLNDRAKILLNAETDAGTIPFAISYENDDGARFLIFSVHSETLRPDSSFFRDYLISAVLKREIPRIARIPIPVAVGNNPALVLIAAQDERSSSVGLFNCSEDAVLKPRIAFPAPVRVLSSAGCNAVPDGSGVVLSAPLPAKGFAALTVAPETDPGR